VTKGREHLDKNEFVNRFIADDVQSEKGLSSKSRKCVFPGCSEVAGKSHTISKENALRSIARCGEVFTFKPMIKERIHILEAHCVGIGDASAFYGFCRKHDNIFQGIDHGAFKTEYDLALQLFRCIGKWKFVESEKARLIDRHQQTIIDNENEIFKKLGMPIIELDGKGYDSGLDEIDEMYDDLVSAIERDKDQLELRSIVGRKVIKLGKWTALYMHLDYQIPLALSSRNPFGINGDIFSIIWVVVPQENSTDIMILLDADGINKHIGSGLVEKRWDFRTSSHILVLETVEAAMAGTENWYMKPDTYESLSEEKKDNLRFDIRYKCFFSHVWEAIDYTIFEDLWGKLLAEEKNPKIIKAASEKMAVMPKMTTIEDWSWAEEKLSQRIFNIYHPWK